MQKGFLKFFEGHGRPSPVVPSVDPTITGSNPSTRGKKNTYIYGRENHPHIGKLLAIDQNQGDG